MTIAVSLITSKHRVITGQLVVIKSCFTYDLCAVNRHSRSWHIFNFPWTTSTVIARNMTKHLNYTLDIKFIHKTQTFESPSTPFNSTNYTTLDSLITRQAVEFRLQTKVGLYSPPHKTMYIPPPIRAKINTIIPHDLPYSTAYADVHIHFVFIRSFVHGAKVRANVTQYHTWWTSSTSSETWIQMQKRYPIVCAHLSPQKDGIYWIVARSWWKIGTIATQFTMQIVRKLCVGWQETRDTSHIRER